MPDKFSWIPKMGEPGHIKDINRAGPGLKDSDNLGRDQLLATGIPELFGKGR